MPEFDNELTITLKTICLVLGFALSGIVQAQISPIDQSSYSVLSFSSDNESHPVAHAFDGDQATWWAIWNSAGFSLPAVVELDLDSIYDVAGFSYLPNAASVTAKALSYEVYTSEDGSIWEEPEAASNFAWADDMDVKLQEVQFGAIKGRFVRIVFPTSLDASSGNIHTNELVIYESEMPATGQRNQIISFDPVQDKISTDPDFEIIASSSSGLALTFEIVSGPATINENVVSLTGAGGEVIVKATQAGDSVYYPVEALSHFEVIDLSVFQPIVTTSLSEEYPVQMDSLSAYPIYFNASVDPLVSIDFVEVEIDGETHPANERNGFFYYLWTPSKYGSFNVDLRATASNGNITTVSRNVIVTESASSQTVRTMEDVIIWYTRENSRWFYGEYSLPQHLGVYDRIVAHLNIECPENDCDDWDRLAYIDVKGPDGNWIQLIRYITPYRVACSHELDVTDFASLLQGDIEIRMFIDTWGTGGWQVTLDFEHQAGTPEYRYSNVDEIWDKAYDLGNPGNLQPVDTIHYEFAPNIKKSTLRLSTTGHGWGDNNSQNAAEFYSALHFIDINDELTFFQNLWTTCDPNPDGCTGQFGTWRFSRAGWCPGAIAQPNEYDLTPNIDQGAIVLTYRFDPYYTDYCHPNNPDCISGITCPDCNDGYKAVNHVDAQIINFSNTPLLDDMTSSLEFVDNLNQYDLQISPNPTTDMFSVESPDIREELSLRLFTVDGSQVKAYRFASSQELNQFQFNISDLQPGTYFLNLECDSGNGTAKIIVQ